MKNIIKLLFITTISVTNLSCAISTLKFYPSLNGVVINNGIPIKNAKVTFIVSYFRKNHTITHIENTDEEGNFTLPESSKFLLYGPHTHVSHQTLLIKYKGMTYIGIDGDRDYMKGFSENLTLNIICDISNVNTKHTFKELNGNSYNPKEIANNSSKTYNYNGICITRRSSGT